MTFVKTRYCNVCGQRIRSRDARLRYCSDECRAQQPSTRFKPGPAANANGGREGSAYKAATAEVRRRARDGEPCHLCGGGFDWTVGANDPRAFTAHHLDRLMDGHPAVVHHSRMAPAHRGCNSADGLRQANLRRAQRKVTVSKFGGRK